MADAFLHLHHTGEDVGLWPLVRTRNPGREEVEMMPAVAATLADQQDRAVEHEPRRSLSMGRWGEGAATKVPSLQQAMARRAP